MSRPTELRRGRRLSAAPSKQAEMRTSWMSQKGNTVSPQRLALGIIILRIMQNFSIRESISDRQR